MSSAWADQINSSRYVPQATLISRNGGRFRIPVMRPNNRIAEPHIMQSFYKVVCNKLGSEDLLCVEGTLHITDNSATRTVGIVEKQ